MNKQIEMKQMIRNGGKKVKWMNKQNDMKEMIR
jgi:hypothetical protein